MNDRWIDDITNYREYIDSKQASPELVFYTNVKDCFIGSFGSYEAAQQALAHVDFDTFGYPEDTDDDDFDRRKIEKRPHPAGFVIAHCLGATLAANVVKTAGEKAASDTYVREMREWQLEIKGTEAYNSHINDYLDDCARDAREYLETYMNLSESNENGPAKKRPIEECLSDYIASDNDEDSVDMKKRAR
jgi:hypothetical protein